MKRLLAPWRWWTALDPAERVLYRAVLLLGVGFALVNPALAFIVPGTLFALTFLVSIARRPR